MSAPESSEDGFAERLVRWQRSHGRHDLPWQGSRDPYRVWLSEIMLQQTQVKTVLPYFEAFVASFPDVRALAAAPQEEVMRVWSGLGYYSRARNLHRCAQRVVADYEGRFPDERPELEKLPGIGRTTAAAIAVFAFGRREAILDGNVKRVLCRHGLVEGPPDQPATLRRLWTLAEARLPSRSLRAYTQGLMDLGATVCTRHRPDCERCPVSGDCAARAGGRQADLPTPRPRRALPGREAWVVVLLRGDRVWLPARPPRGIWAGLRSLPELVIDPEGVSLPAPTGPASTPEGRSWLIRSLDEAGVKAPAAEGPGGRALAPIDHVFTHFRLRLHPWLVRLDGPPMAQDAAPVSADPDAWVALGRLDTAPLPAPIRRLLEGVRAQAMR